MRVIHAILPLFFLSACLDADLSMNFRDRETVDVAMNVTMGRDLYDVVGGMDDRFCSGGDLQVDEDAVTCQKSTTESIDALIAHQKDRAEKFDLARAVSVERLDADRVRVTLDPQVLARQGRGLGNMGQFGSLMRASLDGHALVFDVTGPAIEETTGTLSSDGQTASWRIDLKKLAKPGADLGEPFVTTVSLQHCFLWVFCD